MYQAAGLLFLFAETPYHPGSGQGDHEIDSRVQRELHTGYPMTQGSSIKGPFRTSEGERRGQTPNDDKTFEVLFGPPTNPASAHAGALSFPDGRILLLPVRSEAGVSAWITSADALMRLVRAMGQAEIAGAGRFDSSVRLSDGQMVDWRESLPALFGVSEGEAVVPSDTALLIDPESEEDAADELLLAGLWLRAREDTDRVVESFGAWLASQALPVERESDYWRELLPTSLAVVSSERFRILCKTETAKSARITLNDRRTAAGTALWVEELLPPDTLLYSLALASRPRTACPGITDAKGVLAKFECPPLLQFGGDATLGRGWLRSRLLRPISGTAPGPTFRIGDAMSESRVMGPELRSPEHTRAEYAWWCVQAARGDDEGKDGLSGRVGKPEKYLELLRRTPAMVAGSGLLRTLAYLAGKGTRLKVGSANRWETELDPKHPHGRLFLQLARWLTDGWPGMAAVNPAPPFSVTLDDPLALTQVIATRSLARRRQAAEESIALAGWMKSFGEVATERGSVTDPAEGPGDDAIAS